MAIHRLLADLREGEIVLDLGLGAGINVLVSARRVDETGKAYGLDMTPEMLAASRANQATAGATDFEFSSVRSRTSRCRCQRRRGDL